MTAALSARSLIATLGLLTLGTSASAECAWVWWEEYETAMARSPTTRTWATPVAFPTQAACEGHLTRLIETWEAAHNPLQSVSRDLGGLAAEFRTESPGGFRTSVRRYCLPDTVDPRGPKGMK